MNGYFYDNVKNAPMEDENMYRGAIMYTRSCRIGDDVKRQWSLAEIEYQLLSLVDWRHYRFDSLSVSVYRKRCLHIF